MSARSMTWTAKDLAALRRMWAEGVSLAEIGAAVGGRSSHAVSNKARFLRLPKRGNGGGHFRPDPERDATLVRMWMGGAAQKDISRTIGTDASNLYYHIERLGLPRRVGRGEGAMPEPVVATVDRARFRDLWRDGVPEPEIARSLKITVSVVRHIRNELGLMPRPASGRKTWRAREARKAAPEAVPAAIAAPVAAPSRAGAPRVKHPFWTPERDAAVLKTDGVYRNVAALAARIGKPTAAILYRWHQLRVA